jgi:predicted PP-loop superfamily ATPase
MKKHLSNDTFVEQLKVEIPKNDVGFVTCKNCNVMIETKVAFDLFNLNLKNLETGQLVEFGAIEARSKEKNAI